MRISLPKKLLIIILFPLLLDVGEIVLFEVTTSTFSTVRAYVNGESLWSKAQKDAVNALQQYTVSRDKNDYEKFLNFLEVPLGNRAARLALEQEPPDLESADAGFIQGKNHPADVRDMSLFFLRYQNAPYVRDAFAAWAQADLKITELQRLGEMLRAAIEDGATVKQLDPLTRKLAELNTELTRLETEFSNTLGTASRVAKDVLLTSILLVSIVFVIISVIVPLYLGKNILSSVQKLKTATLGFRAGEFKRIELDSTDELGELADTFNEMCAKLNASYRALEERVIERTRSLQESKNILEAEIQQRNELEDKLRAHAVALAKSDQAKDEFLATFAHELRNPLAPIVMSLELLEAKYKDDAELQVTVDVLKRQAGFMQRIVNELLDVSRLSVGKIELRLTEADMCECVRDAVQLAQPTLKSKYQTMQVTLPHTPTMAMVDTLRIGQILTNLLSNASKFTPIGGSIQVRLEQREEQIFVCVVDNGSGIIKDDLSRIFLPFFQGVSSSQGAKEGLGIGLTLSRSLAQLHNGDLTVTSEGEGKGSIFTLRIPCRPFNKHPA